MQKKDKRTRVQNARNKETNISVQKEKKNKK